MIKKFLIVLLGAALVTSVVCGCAGSSDAETTVAGANAEAGTTASEADSEAGKTSASDTAPLFETASYGTAAKLGEYKGLEVTQTVQEINDDDIETEIQMILGQSPEKIEVTDRPAEIGDTVSIDYAGTIDGVAFDGGTGSYDLLLGSGQFIPGFEDQVEGMKVGDTKDVKCTFPDNYQAADLAGKDAVFKTTLNKISISKTPEFTDAWVETYTGGDCKTTAEFKDAVRKELQDYCDESSLQKTKAALMAQVINNTEFEFNEDAVQKMLDEMTASYESYASQYGMDLDTFLQMNGMNAEGLKEYTYSLCKQSIVEQAIFDKENMTLTEEDYQTLADSNGMTVEALKAQFGATADEAAKSYKVDQFIYDNAKITKEQGQVLN